MSPIISVIMPVRNEAASIERVLLSLFQQQYDPAKYEIIVVDGESTDETPSIVRRMQSTYSNLSLYHNPRRLSSAARNIGVTHSRGQYLIIVDGHCTIERDDYLAQVERAFVESGAATLGRPQPLRQDNGTFFQRCLARARQSKLGHNPDSAIFSNQPAFVRPQNVAVAYRRDVFDRVGLFDESFDACEDVEFNYRVDQAGFNCYFTPHIGVNYHPRSNLRGLMYQMYRYGRGRTNLALKHPASLTWPALVPGLWLVWLILGAIMSYWFPSLALVLLTSIGLYLAVIAVTSVKLAWREPTWALAWLPVIFLAIHVSFGWGTLRKLTQVHL